MAPDQHHNKKQTSVAEVFSRVVEGDTGSSSSQLELLRQVELMEAAAAARSGGGGGGAAGQGSIDKIFTIIAAAAMQQQSGGSSGTTVSGTATTPREDGERVAPEVLLPQDSTTPHPDHGKKMKHCHAGQEDRRPSRTAASSTEKADATTNTTSTSSVPPSSAGAMGCSTSISSSSATTNTARQQQPKEKKDLRKGKWTPEEEEYASRIIYFVQNGILELPEGTTLRSYLAERLNCDPMRITKKIAGASCCLGKRSSHFGGGRAQQASPREITMAKAELEQLEERFKLRQKLGNCNLPLHIWPELYTQRSAAAQAAADLAPEVTEPTPLVVLPPPFHYPISMQEAAAAAATTTTSISSLDKNFGSSNPTTAYTADGLAPSANEMSKLFQSYSMALQASSSASSSSSSHEPSPSMVVAGGGGGGGATTSVAASQFAAMLPQYPFHHHHHQQQQPVEMHSTIDPNSFTTNLLASMFPNLPSPTLGSTNSHPLKAAATASSGRTVAPPGNTSTTVLPQLSLPQPHERTSTPNSLLPATASPSTFPISSQSTNINNTNNAWVNQQSVPSTPVFPNLPLPSSLPTAQGNATPEGSVFAQSMAWANIAQFTHTLFQIAAANSQTCYSQQQQQQQQSPWLNSWPFNGMSSIPSMSSQGMFPNAPVISNNAIPPHLQQLLLQLRQQQPNLMPQCQPQKQQLQQPSLTSQLQQLPQENKPPQIIQINEQENVQKCLSLLAPLNRNQAVEHAVQPVVHSKKVEKKAPTLPKDSIVKPKKMCKEDEDASNTLLGFMSSLRENYDKAREQQKEAEGLKPRSDVVVVHEEDMGFAALQKNFHRALAQNQAEEERYSSKASEASTIDTFDLVALQNNFHRVMAQQQQHEEKEWAIKAAAIKNNDNHKKLSSMYPYAGQVFTEESYTTNKQRDLSADQSTATFVSRSSDGHFWKKSLKQGPAVRSSLKAPIGKSLKAISLVSNQASDISDDSEKSAIRTGSKRWNESCKSSTSTADLIREGEAIFQCDTSGGSVSSCESKMDPSLNDPKLVERKTFMYDSPRKSQKRRMKRQSEFTSKNVADHTTLMDSLESAKRLRSLW